MDRHGPASFGYRLQRAEEGWRWATLAPDGAVRAQGFAPTRAAAAAQVIRALADAALNAGGAMSEREAEAA